MYFEAKYSLLSSRYKSYITPLKAVIAGKKFISPGMNIDGILYFVFYDKILQFNQQH